MLRKIGPIASMKDFFEHKAISLKWRAESITNDLSRLIYMALNFKYNRISSFRQYSEVFK
jgi:hypothetical protein